MRTPSLAHTFSPTRSPATLLAYTVCFLVFCRQSGAQTYSPILDPSESQTPQGVRGAAGSDVLLACSYTTGSGTTQGMWWMGSLTTGSGISYKVSPVLPAVGGGTQTVTSSLYYGPNTPEFDPSLGAGNIRMVGSYVSPDSRQDTNGVLYTGPLSGTGGTWKQLDVPDVIVSATVANTIPHSVMGSIVVGNYDLVVGSSSALGNAFLYDISGDTWTVFDSAFGGTDKLTSAYGVWQNGIGSTSYTIAGGSKDAGIDKAFLVDYDSVTNAFSNLTYFFDGAPAGLTHFEGITGAPYGYNVIGIAGTGYAFATITRNQDGSFGSATWTGPLSYPNSSMTTGNTVIGNEAIGIYTLGGSSDVYAYVASVPEPSHAFLAAAGSVLASFMTIARWRRSPGRAWPTAA